LVLKYGYLFCVVRFNESFINVLEDKRQNGGIKASLTGTGSDNAN
jgi:hypothetical protein